MTDIFVQDNDEIRIVVAIGKNRHGAIFAANDTVELKELYEDEALDESTIQEFEVIFKQPSFKDSVELAMDFSIGNEKGFEFNPVASRYKKITKLIKSWTLKDGEGNAVPATENNVAKLHPSVAGIIGTSLDIYAPVV